MKTGVFLRKTIKKQQKQTVFRKFTKISLYIFLMDAQL